MKILSDFSEIPEHQSAVLTMGNFDGLHLGHQHLLSHVKQLSNQSISVVLTFKNHPLEVINPNSKPALIITPQHKLLLLEKFGIEWVIQIPFTKEIADLSYDNFLVKLKEKLKFTDLVLGQGASFGRKKQGTQENIEAMSSSLGFKCHYLSHFFQEHDTVSSGRIRKQIASGDLKALKTLLGRLYSLYLPFAPDSNGEYITDLSNFHLQLPPNGSYSVSLKEPKVQTQLHLQDNVFKLDYKGILPSLPVEIIFNENAV